MQDKPYFCPNCRSNRVKFSIISSVTQSLWKDAITGAVTETFEMQPIETDEPTVQCIVCGFTGNEMRFVKQAEREPRTPADVRPSLS